MQFMSFKLIKTNQKNLIFLNLLGTLAKKCLYRIILHSIYFLEIFRNHQKMFAILEFIR